MNAPMLEREERRTGRHAVLLSKADGLRLRLEAQSHRLDSVLMGELMAVIVRQEIELRQAIEDKRARQVAFRL